MKNQKSNRGMTLIEIIVVITILSMLMAAVSVAVIPMIEKARVSTAKMDLGAIRTGLKSYYLQKLTFPPAQKGLQSLVDEQVMDKLPVDPWNHPYVYFIENGQPIIKSLGRDGQVGGEDFDADLVSDMKGEKKEPSTLTMREHVTAHGSMN